jgi:hypothetical protein
MTEQMFDGYLIPAGCGLTFEALRALAATRGLAVRSTDGFVQVGVRGRRMTTQEGVDAREVVASASGSFVSGWLRRTS